MNVLFVGDIVGPEAAGYLAERLPTLRRQHGADLVIANAENCAVTGPSPMNGFGMSAEAVDLLLESGVDVITGGNHSWDGPEAEETLSRPEVLRPHNVPGASPGKGALTVDAAGGRATVLNLLSETARLPDKLAPDPTPPHGAYEAWRRSSEGSGALGAVIVDFHGDSSWEKASFAAAVDGEVAAVLGTHTHDPTLRCHALPGGTAFVAEVGMTGRLGFTGGGFDPAHFAAALKGEDLGSLPPYELSTGPMALGAVLVRIEGGGAVAAERIH
jgi:calcineurin-like phosphoesterase